MIGVVLVSGETLGFLRQPNLRGLRIESSNAVVWHYLARVRFVQGRPEQAVAAAAKSNALAGDNRAVTASNWRIIAAARRRQGDADGARAADERAAAVVP